MSDPRGPGYLCKCKFGSPEPGVVRTILSLHDRDCPMRIRIGSHTEKQEGIDDILKTARIAQTRK